MRIASVKAWDCLCHRVFPVVKRSPYLLQILNTFLRFVIPCPPWRLAIKGFLQECKGNTNWYINCHFWGNECEKNVLWLDNKCVILVFTGLGIWRAVADIYKKRASPVSSSLSSTWLSLGEQRDAGGHERIMGEQLTLIRSERHSGWPQDPRRAQPNHSSHWLWQMSAAQCPTPTQKSNHWSHWGKIPP